jgi:pyrrolidone-carboxylate peptidase
MEQKLRNNEIWGFAFNLRNSATRTLYQVVGFDYRYLIFPNNIDSYLNKVLASKPAYILGVGMSNPGSKLKIELEARNRKGRSSISDRYELDSKITISGSRELQEKYVSRNLYMPDLRFANTVSWSWCNYMAWKIQMLINEQQLETKLVFIHYPKKFSEEIAKENIEKLLAILKIDK